MSILQRILASFAKATLVKHKPIIVVVTGSVGKTSTRHAVAEVLKKFYRVRMSHKNHNTEMDVLLTILGIEHYGNNIVAQFGALIHAACNMYVSKKAYPEVLILEYGVNRPGDMDRLISIARPNIAVVTAIGEVPSHIEFFKDVEELTAEKAKLVQALSIDGYAILNHDDYGVYDMKEKTKAHVMTYGFEEQAEVRIVNYELRLAKDENLGDIPDGITFKIQQNGSIVPIRLHNVFGRPSCYAAASAAAVGLVLNRNLVEISEALHSYQSPPGRLCLVKGIKRSFILDDTYNASPESMRSALDTLKALPGKRKIAVLGDMLEIGRYTEQAHRSVGDQASEFVDLLITVGARAKFIADEALNHGLEKHVCLLAPAQVMSFDNPVDAGHALDPLIEEGDIVLVKGGREMRMERAVFEIMAQPLRAKELLIRQE
ncbi:MAG: UDP-N-acetylmuramoyl-tripeptide--D-alanyl-D-alanine ligase [Candidatus Sungbacteria bacterium]|nr:UDP-N-acetylmuramoyl-tripeptide--D-alanyl-D-alanine ligase [bacterium]MDZ4260410.1 UDP-N-acetylmuramoyl-tripeptide--D-alanyl-D-alanine ligase [Candidatus Sungbacteria bacterium]